MKNPESFSSAPGIQLTEEQKANNPNGFWDHTFSQAREQVAKALEDVKDPSNPSVRGTIEEIMKEIPKSKRDFVTEEELLLRGLEYYSEKNQGFGEAKGLEKKYRELRGKKQRMYVEEAVSGMKEVEFDDASGHIEEAVSKIIEKEPGISPEDVTSLRNDLWERYMAEKNAE